MTRGGETKLSGVVVIDTGNDALRERYTLSMARMDSLGEDVPEAFRAYFKEAARFVKESCTDGSFGDRRCADKSGTDRSNIDRNSTEQSRTDSAMDRRSIDQSRTDRSSSDQDSAALAAPHGQSAAENGQPPDELSRLLRLWRAELGALPYLYASGRLMDVDILLETLIQIENTFAACGQEKDGMPPQKAVRDVIYSYLYDYLPVFAEEAADAFLSEHAAAFAESGGDFMAQERTKNVLQSEEKRPWSGQNPVRAAVPVRLLDCVLFPERRMTECLEKAEQCSLPHWELSYLALFQGDRLAAMLLRALREAIRERQPGMRQQSKAHRADAAAGMEQPVCIGQSWPGAAVLFAAPFTAHQQKLNRHMLQETEALWQQVFSGTIVH